MTKEVNQSTVNLVLVGALTVMTAIAGFGTVHLVTSAEARLDKSDAKDEATLKALQAMEKRLTIIETKMDME